MIGEDNNNSNGHKSIEDMAQEKVFEGATVDLGALKRQDGIITGEMLKLSGQQMGIVQTYVHAQKNDDDYRQILKNAIWKSTEEMDKCILAIAVCRLTGAEKGLAIICDRLTARSAGTNGWAQEWAGRTLTHTTFTSQSIQSKANKNDNSKKSNSPLS